METSAMLIVRRCLRLGSAWLTALLLLMAMVCASMGVAHAAETITYYYTSPQGTVLAKADASGNILSNADYRPYGTQALGTPEQGPGYTGHVNDVDSGLVYMQARYYDPSLGRFVSADPQGPSPGRAATFNRYGYASNNPVVYVDPDGREAACVTQASHCGGDPQSAAAATSSLYQMGLGVGKGIVNGLMELDASLQRGTQETPDFEPSNAEQAGGMVVGTIAVEAAKSLATEGRSAEAGAAKAESRLTYLYQKLDASGGHLKYGITYSPASRYTSAEMNGGSLKILATGGRGDMLKLERGLHETLPIGPEEKQTFYIQKQVDQGLKPPPYQ